MSSAPQPPMYRPYRRSLTGPFILIVIGVCFLLANLHVMPWVNFGYFFARYWPLMLIAIGIIKLVEYYAGQRGGYRAGGIGAGGVVFLVFLCIFGLAATKASHVNWNGVGDQMDWDNNGWNWWGQTYNFTDQIEQPYTAGDNLQVVSDHGDITVNAWDQNTVRVVIHKRVVGDSQDSANKTNESTKPTVTVGDKLITINANTTGGGSTRVASDLEIFVPAAAAADLSTRRGDIVVRNRGGDIKASSTHGDVTIEDVKGAAIIKMRSGDVQVNNVTGDVTLESHVSDTNISNVGGSLRLNGEFTGEMKLSKIAGGVQFTSSRTDLHFAKLDGDMSMDMGEFRANQLAGPFVIVTRSKDIHLEDISGDVRVENTNGEVEVNAGKLPLGTISIDNHRGEVQVTLPAKSAFQLDARTQRGEISNDFSDGVRQDNTGGQASATGNVGNGGPKLTITNQYGAIRIHKAS